MKLSDLISSLISDVSGGETSQSPQLDPQWVKKILPSIRAEFIESDYLKQAPPRRINPYCVQKVYLKFDSLLQSSAPTGAVIFKCPKFIGLDNKDGLLYGGTLGGIDSGLPLSRRICIQQWNRVYDRGELANYQRRHFTRFENNPDYVFFLYNNNDGVIELYNCPTCTEAMLEGVLDDPLKATNFNQEVDEYPIDVNSLDAIRNLIYKDKTSIAKGTKPDDSADMSQNIPQKPIYNRPIQN